MLGLVGTACSDVEPDGAFESSRAALECEGVCPIYVDPGATEAGDGSSWESPLISVQAAIDAQASVGGGAVWVRGGGPFATLVGSHTETLITLRPGVQVFGGFTGTEAAPDERDPASRTILTGVPGHDDGGTPLISGASNSTIDGFSVSQHRGPAVYQAEAVTSARVVNLAIAGAAAYAAGGLVKLAGSEVGFDGLSITDSTGSHGIPGVHATNSTLRISNSEFLRGLNNSQAQSAAVAVWDSTLIVDHVRFARNSGRYTAKAAALFATNSDVLLTDTEWIRNGGDQGTISTVNTNLVAVNFQFESNGNITTPIALTDSDALFLNATFLGNRAFSSAAVHVSGGRLRIVNGTFLDNKFDLQGSTKPYDISVWGSAQVALHNSYSNNGARTITAPYTGSGNCILDTGDAYRETVGDVTHVLLRPEFDCVDDGDDAAATVTTDDAAAFASSLGATIPLGANWWQSSSSVLDVPADVNAIDPGRHY